MSSTYTTVTGTVSFTASTDSWSEPSPSEVNVLGFPGGDAVAISIAGQRETRRTFKALFASATVFRTFRDMRAKQGWLFVDVWDSTPVHAVLLRTAPDAIQVDGQVLATAEFVLY